MNDKDKKVEDIEMQIKGVTSQISELLGQLIDLYRAKVNAELAKVDMSKLPESVRNVIMRQMREYITGEVRKLIDLYEWLVREITRIQNMASAYHALVCPHGHITIVDRETEGSFFATRAKKLPDELRNEVVKLNREGIIKTDFICPQCNVGNAVNFYFPPDPILSAVQVDYEILKDIVSKLIDVSVKNSPVYRWGKYVYGMGANIIARLIDIITSVDEPKISKIWAHAGIAPIMVCPDDKIISLTPASHQQRCPKCGKPMIGILPSKKNTARLRQLLGDRAFFARFNRIDGPVSIDEAIREIMPNPDLQKSAYIIARMFFPPKPETVEKGKKKISAYTIELLRVMQRTPQNVIQRARKAMAKGGTGMNVLFGFWWPNLARKITDAAFTVYMIDKGLWQGPLPTLLTMAPAHKVLPWNWIGPLVDDIDEALKDPFMEKVIKEVKEKAGIDLEAQWKWYAEQKERYAELYDEVERKIRGG
jgi:predicted RNA-binding Zn-ribbon protein involved in translation (DUF1610 family)/chaperonin cofactor prefoldin